jgi:hypothetical protein
MFIKNVLSSFSNNEITRPIFILGCGRSGTTIFGTALSKHNSITYLNERRDLWFKAYPETDTWTRKAKARGGKMKLTSENVDSTKSQILRRLFYRETIKSTKPILVEKLPINNFRVEFIHSIFPDARFIHIYRNGLEVALSIQKASDNGDWFGANEYKWERLKEYSIQSSDTIGLPELCDNYYSKGLLEWRLSTESAVRFLSTLPQEKYFEISYAELSSKPIETINQVLAYIEVDADQSVVEFASKNIFRRTKNLENSSLSELEAKLGGALLPVSMDNNGDGLTNAYTQTK